MDNNLAYRRKYPLNQKGAKEEWLGIHQHQLEIQEELQTVEKDIKDLKKNTLLTNYQMDLLNKLEIRQNELENKKMEGEFMVQRGQEFQDSLKKMKVEKDVFLGFMKQNYDTQLQEKNQMKKLENDEKLNYENNLIAYNQRKLESERRRRLQQKFNLKKEVDEQMQMLADKNKRMQVEQIVTKDESNELMKQRAMAEIMKEEGYKNFYRQWDQYDNNLRAIHENKVTNQNNAKQNGVAEFVHKNIEQYNKKVMQQEYEKQLKFANDKNNMINTIQNQLNDKELQRKDDMERKMSNQNQRLNDLQSYQQYLQQQKHEKLERQNQYRDVLDKQKELSVQNNLNAFRMGGPEKRMNFNDLQAYKEMSKISHAKLIGYSPQIGGHSDRIKPVPQIETNQNLNQTLSQLANLNLSPTVSPNAISQKNLSVAPITPNMPFKYNNTKNYDIGEQRNYSPQNQIFNYNHNPLINPLPTNIQNPYVAKEYLKAMQQNSIFSANAQRNLRRQE